VNETKGATLTTKALVSGYGRVETLHGVDIEVPRGGITAVIGPNGSGKSTLLKSITGLLKPWSGEVLLDGENIAGRPAHKLVEVGMCTVPQGRVVFPLLTVQENLEMSAFTLRDRSEVNDRVAAAYDFLPVLGERRKQIASSLSGGEQVLLSIAKVIMQNPKILLLDEPSLGLSPKMMDFVYEKLRDLTSSGLTTFLVEQNVRKALEIADHMIVLVLGERRFMGTPQQVEQEVDLGTLFLEGKIV
jgi:branched-chain amino acid transport system ATP-binding protein